ncbi:MAG TPA: DNA methyltransferase [Bacillota bacterium]|jgi:DNA modification methylase|nr:DNA methyltransferase [Bacillota bacterium]
MMVGLLGEDGGPPVENELNDLSGSEWLYWTGTLYPTNYPPDPTHALRKVHGAMKPPGLMAEIVSFFTKKGELVLDPFAGVGGTLLGAQMAGRRAVGIELNPAWVAVYRRIQGEFSLGEQGPVRGGAGRPITAPMLTGDCLELLARFPAGHFAAIITDPPYGCKHRVGFKKETNFAMFNPKAREDFGNAQDFAEYYVLMERFGREAYRLLPKGRYLVMLIGDRYQKGEYLPLGVRVAEVMQRVGFRWKGTRIWWNQATQRPLRPYAVKRCFIPNIQHQNLIILRKE